MRIIIISLTIILAGCGSMQRSSLEQITLPDGEKGWMVDCSYTGMPACFQTAGVHCPNGYTIFERTNGNSNKSGFPVEGLVNQGVVSGEIQVPHHPRQDYYRSDKYMIIRCK